MADQWSTSTSLTLVEGHSVRVEAKGQARYWTVQDEEVLVAPTLAELLASMTNPRPDPGALAAMAAGRCSIWLSPFQDVHRLTFGHELHATPTGPRVTRWLHPESTAPACDVPAVEVMREAIEAAVDDATRGHQGAIVALSGGLDSTILLALAARNARLRPGLRGHCASPHPEWVLDVPGRLADEWGEAEAVAAYVGVPARRIVNDGLFSWLDAADDFHRRNLMPVTVPANMWWLSRLEARAASGGPGIILIGQSGNSTFSNGPHHAARPLLADGTRAPAYGLRPLAHFLHHALIHGTRCAVRPDTEVRIPDHILDLDPWTRWCLAEPPTSSHGPWTGADVTWLDPLGSARVITAAHSLPSSAWGPGPDDRTLAYAVGRGRIPIRVLYRPERGVQGADMPGTLLAQADAHAAAVHRVAESPTAREFLDTDVLTASVELLRGDLKSARVFQQHYLKSLAVGLFAAWWDESGRHVFP